MKNRQLKIYKKKDVTRKLFLFRLSIVVLWILLFFGGMVLLLEYDLDPILLFPLMFLATIICLFYWGRFKTTLFLNIYYSLRSNDRFLLKDFIKYESFLLSKKDILKIFEIIPNARREEFNKAIQAIETSEETDNRFVDITPNTGFTKISPLFRNVLYGLMWVVVIVGIIYLIRIANKNSEHAKEMNSKYGTEVDCRLIYKYKTRSQNINYYSIYFDFVYNDSLIKVENEIGRIETEDFEKTIIGLKYKAIVILEGDNKFEYSKILLDKPIPESFSNIHIEREDIKSRYKSAEGFIEDYGRTGEELNEIWKEYYK